MTLRAVTPAPIGDVLELYAAGGQAKPLTVSAAILQAARAETIGFYAGGVIVAAALLYPCDPEFAGEDLRELVFACRPQAARHLVAILHIARLTRLRLAEIADLRIRARVRAGHAPGRRLARLAGLAHAATAGGLEDWEWRSGHGGFC